MSTFFVVLLFQEFESDNDDFPESIEEALDYFQEIQVELLKEGISFDFIFENIMFKNFDLVIFSIISQSQSSKKC